MRNFKIIDDEEYMLVWQLDNKSKDCGYDQLRTGIISREVADRLYDKIVSEGKETYIGMYSSRQSESRWKKVRTVGTRRY